MPAACRRDEPVRSTPVMPLPPKTTATPVCANCKASEPAMWRRVGDALLCNPCGLYLKARGRARPMELVARRPRGSYNRRTEGSPLKPRGTPTPEPSSPCPPTPDVTQQHPVGRTAVTVASHSPSAPAPAGVQVGAGSQLHISEACMPGSETLAGLSSASEDSLPASACHRLLSATTAEPGRGDTGVRICSAPCIARVTTTRRAAGITATASEANGDGERHEHAKSLPHALVASPPPQSRSHMELCHWSRASIAPPREDCASPGDDRLQTLDWALR